MIRRLNWNELLDRHISPKFLEHLEAELEMKASEGIRGYKNLLDSLVIVSSHPDAVTFFQWRDDQNVIYQLSKLIFNKEDRVEYRHQRDVFRAKLVARNGSVAPDVEEALYYLDMACDNREWMEEHEF